MKKHNPDNERIKRTYLRFLKESKGRNESSIDSVAMALSRFETHTKHRDFKKFHYEQAIRFKKHLSEQNNRQTGKKLSKSTLNTTFGHLKNFFKWLAMQPGYKSRVNYTDAEYFNLSEKDTRIATAHHVKPSPSLEQVKHVINMMPSETVIERRDRALIAFTLVTGARDSAIASMKLKHVDLSENSVYQDAREVRTKFSKTFKTYFFPVGDDIHKIVKDWVNFLRDDLMWSDDDPLFPKTAISLGDNQLFEASGFKREHWSTATPIREIFKKAFTSADLPYYNPHSLRKTLTRLGQQMCQSIEHFKAWSQNLGHEQVLTTLTSYGEVQTERQGEIIKNLDLPNHSDHLNVEELAKAVVREMKNTN
ncbi:MAG: site-specific integrase [Gammaproteobacteria bacterium]|nr:site-specific integrase [Gammaproteobacteria bacterium]